MKVGTSSEPGGRLRELRRRRGLTQEGLAEAAGLSVQCIKKIEQGGTARMETYRQIAKALGVTTVWFVSPGAPEPVAEDNNDALLVEMRAAIAPPVGIDGAVLSGGADADDIALPRLREAIDAVALAYHGDKYDHLAQVFPALIRSAQFHVSRFDSGDDQKKALRLRADVLGLAGRYLIQVRAHDLAMTALHQSIRDALAIGDAPLAASGVAGQGWAMLRQGRFNEVERVCAKSAQGIEPRMSQATMSELAAWGWLLMRAAGAAVRNNRTTEAQEYLALAETAGTRLGDEKQNILSYAGFGPISVGLMRAETAMIAGEPGEALQIMDGLPRPKSRPKSDTWNRGQIEMARAWVEVGDTDKATEVLSALKAKSPEWLRYQQRARDTAQAILKARTRIPSAEQRHLADFLGVHN